MHFVNSLLVVTFLHFSFVAGQLYKGDECQLKNNKSGICKLITECPEAIASIRKGIFPQQCGFEGIQVILCCAVVKLTVQPTTVQTKPPTVKPTPTKPPTVTSRSPGVVSYEKCVEYSQYIWKIDLNPTLLLDGVNIGRHECPFNRQKRVVGGNQATRREFPHMVQFGYEASDGLIWTCGGSLISERFVLTAAHCLSDRSLGDAKFARMGLEDFYDDDHMQQYGIIELIPYPKYERPSYYHDIGLVKLNNTVELNTWVRPACLFTNISLPWSEVIASGWGKTYFLGEESTVLIRVILELYDQQKCNSTYRQQTSTDRLRDGIRDELMVCAGHSKELRSTCQGDSGGPIQVYKDGEKQLSCMYNIVGVGSFGKACGLAVNVPSVFTRVAYYTKWIEDIVWPIT